MLNSPRKLGTVALALVALAACGKKDAPRTDTTAMAPAATPAAPAPVVTISTIETGKHLGANKRVTVVDSVFSPKDTLYASVVTANGTPSNTVTAKWTFQSGQMVDSTSQTIARTDSTNSNAVTEFHIVKLSGWPVGKYKVEIWLNAVSAGARDIVVKK